MAQAMTLLNSKLRNNNEIWYSVKTRSAKAKGRRLQNFVHDQLHQAFPDLHADDIRVVPMGTAGEDIQLSPQARTLIPVSIECKNHERIQIWGAIRQALLNAEEKGCAPAIVFARNRHNPFVAIPFELFISLLRK